MPLYSLSSKKKVLKANKPQTNSLVGSVYKIMDILQVERLKRVMGNLVSAQQSAFLEARQTTNASLMPMRCWIGGLKSGTRCFM